MTYVVFLLYVGSLALAFGSVESYFVVRPGTLMLIGAMLLAPTVLVVAFFRRNERVGVVAAHLFLAVLFHPAISLNAPEYTDKGAQMELFNKIHASGVDPGEQGYWSYELSRSLMDKERLSFKGNNPMKYWMYPPSVVLFIWGCLAFLYLPVTTRRRITPT